MNYKDGLSVTDRRAYDRQYYASRRTEILAQRTERDPAARHASFKAWYQAHREEVAARRARQRADAAAAAGIGSIRSCLFCDGDFIVKMAATKCCSPRCAKLLASQNRRHTLECDVCGATFRSAYATALRCSPACRNKALNRRKYAAGTKRQATRLSERKRRAIFERDQWRCRLCRAVIDAALRFPHPGSKSIDHIIPSSLGGSDDPDNLQATHFACNVAKGAREAMAA